jgi:hypothetical protein
LRSSFLKFLIVVQSCSCLEPLPGSLQLLGIGLANTHSATQLGSNWDLLG